MLAYVGVCWPILRAMWAHLVAMLAFVGLMLTHVEPKDPKNGNSKKNTVKRRIFWWSAAYLGASWGYVGPSWGLCWPILGLCRPILELCWPNLGLCWPILGLCWPILGLSGPILRPMLAHVDPSWATRAEKWQKMRRAQKHRKTRDFLAGGSGSPAGAAAPLSYGEERTAVRLCHGQGAPGRIKGLPPTAADLCCQKTNLWDTMRERVQGIPQRHQKTKCQMIVNTQSKWAIWNISIPNHMLFEDVFGWLLQVCSWCSRLCFTR